MLIGSGGPGSLAVGAVGAVIAVATALDLFVTVFNYDGFTFIAGRYQRGLWRLLRLSARAAPRNLRHAFLSLGSAAMLPATVGLWLGLEITGFALMYVPGLHTHAFRLTETDTSLGTAFYLSAGGISSLTFGDVVPRGGLDRALADLETILGLATFTLALGYVVTAFDVLGRLEDLHGRVRRHADDPEKPSSILARHFKGDNRSALPSFLQALAEDLESYDQGLRRYPVVYYFHTRRQRRSIPHVFATLGELLALLRWGLPSTEPLTEDPFLVALLDKYSATLDRLRRSFVGPHPLDVPDPLDPAAFAGAYRGEDADDGVAAFRRLEERARTATGVPAEADEAARYERYKNWFRFSYRERIVVDRIADTLGYERPSVGARS